MNTSPKQPAMVVCESVPNPTPAEIRKIRQEMGFSQFGFAMKFGIPLSTVRSWERGARVPRSGAMAFLRTLWDKITGVSSSPKKEKL